MAALLFALAMMVLVHVADATFALNWRLIMTQNNPGGLPDFINELRFYDGNDNVITGVYGVNRIDLNLLFINDYNPATAFLFFLDLAPEVGDYISLTCVVACEIKKIYMLQNSNAANRIYSMKLEYSILGVTWTNEWPSFNTNFEEQTYTKPVPTVAPTYAPSSAPVANPTASPSALPTLYPSSHPSGQPSEQPSEQPSSQPSSCPSRQPYSQPTTQPSTQPLSHPSAQPTTQPSCFPSAQPSSQPSAQPSSQPSMQSSSQPTTYSILPSVLASPTYTVRNGFAFVLMNTVTQSVTTWGEGPTGGDSTLVQSLLLDSVTKVVSTRYAYAAIKQDNTTVVWGQSSVTTTHNNLERMNLTSIVASESSFAGITHSGKVKSIGRIKVPAGLSNARLIVASAGAFAALHDDNTVTAWGSVHYGGVIPALIQAQLVNVHKIVACRDSFAALLASGKVVTWGTHSVDNNNNAATVTAQLTEGVVHIIASHLAFVAFKQDSSIVTWGYGPYGGNSSTVAHSLSANITSVVYNSKSMVALKNDGSIVCWGDATDGGDCSAIQSSLYNITTVMGNSKAYAALTSTGGVLTWGKALYGGTIPSTLLSALSGNVVSLHATDRAFAALKSTGELVVWGQTGHGGAQPEIASLLTNVHTVCSNSVAFLAIKTDGAVVGWGHPIAIPTPGVQFMSAFSTPSMVHCV